MAVKALISTSKRIILVTSDYHMYRVKRLFEKQGFEVILYKVDYKASGNKQTTIMDLLPSVDKLKITETGIREFIGRLFYLVKS